MTKPKTVNGDKPKTPRKPRAAKVRPVVASYYEFLERKAQIGGMSGFEPVFMPDTLFPFQQDLTAWSIRKGRGALFEPPGFGKTFQFLVYAENIVRKTNKRVLIATPLAVSGQTIEEATKFGIEAKISRYGQAHPGITVTNYERLEKFNPNDFVGMICDEASAIKAIAGKRRAQVTEFVRRLPYRLMPTATPAPNDYIELGTISEALGELGQTDMLTRFFRNEQGNSASGRSYGKQAKWRFKGHAEEPFWKWLASWARALRRPSDMGYKDTGYILPPIIEEVHTVKARQLKDGFLFEMPAVGLEEQREEQKRTLKERCEKAAELSNTKEPVVIWCNFNSEGDMLADMLPKFVQVSGPIRLKRKKKS
jgi:hypothetical protein